MLWSASQPKEGPESARTPSPQSLISRLVLGIAESRIRAAMALGRLMEVFEESLSLKIVVQSCLNRCRQTLPGWTVSLFSAFVPTCFGFPAGLLYRGFCLRDRLLPAGHRHRKLCCRP